MSRYGQRAYLFLTREDDGPFDLDEVTRTVGLTPTRVTRRGEHRFDTWSHGRPEVDEVDTEVVVVSLPDAIEPYAQGLTAARRDLDLRAGIMVVAKMYGDRDTADGSVGVSTVAICYRNAVQCSGFQTGGEGPL
ncbi:DUF4279 domain-containing protein [Actinoplanes sp. NPDC049596]|uniref:DUF4279 domain-containing protein n=1 Tax=unclassified Actinoplanes TaxID=2626549 RepID=UPI00341A40AF